MTNSSLQKLAVSTDKQTRTFNVWPTQPNNIRLFTVHVVGYVVFVITMKSRSFGPFSCTHLSIKNNARKRGNGFAPDV